MLHVRKKFVPRGLYNKTHYPWKKKPQIHDFHFCTTKNFKVEASIDSVQHHYEPRCISIFCSSCNTVQLSRSVQANRLGISLIHYTGNPVRQGFTQATSLPTKQRVFDVNSGGIDYDASVIDAEKVERATEHAALEEKNKKRKRIARPICHISDGKAEETS